MALGAALATGKPQAYAVVPGPGLLNSAAALLTAYRHECAGAGAGRPNPATPTSAAASATCTRSATRPASSRGWSIIRRASASADEAPRLVAEAMRVDAHRPARSGGARMRHRRLGQARPGRAAARRCRSASRRSTRTRSQRPPSAWAPPSDPLIVVRRRRAGCLGRSDAAVAHAAGAGARAIAAAAACSTAAIRLQRDAAARPRIVGRGRRGARRSARMLYSGFRQWGIDDDLAIIRVDADPEEPDALAQAGRRADRRRRSRSCGACSTCCRRTTRSAPSRSDEMERAPGGMAQAPGEARAAARLSSRPSAPNCRRTAFSSTR